MCTQRTLAYCGLACCLCGEADCPGCRQEGCPDRGACKNLRCCQQRGLEGCWACADFPCESDMFASARTRAFVRFAQKHGQQVLVDLLLEDQARGLRYHREGFTGDYDAMGDEAAIYAYLCGRVTATE
ncbi:MAG: DUF3795 domain-containing protein [Christensenellales bacterium]|jgi:hypothetical protein